MSMMIKAEIECDIGSEDCEGNLSITIPLERISPARVKQFVQIAFINANWKVKDNKHVCPNCGK